MKCIVIVLLVFLTAGLAGESFGGETHAQTEAVGRAPIQLTKREGRGGYYASVQNPHKNPFWSAALVSVDNKDVSNLSEKEIRDLFLGPIGSSIDVSVLVHTGRIKTYKIEREPINRKPMWERKIQYLEVLDSRSPDHWNSGYAEDSMDIDARAAQNMILRHADEITEVSKNSRSASYCCAALTNYEVGNLRDGDILISQGLKEFVPNEYFRLGQNWNVRKAISLLLLVDRKEEAQRLCEMETRKNDFGNVAAAFKELIFSELQNDKAAAVARLDKYVTQENNWGPVRYDRKWIGDVYLKAGESKKALEVYDDSFRLQNGQAANWETVQLLGGVVLTRSFLQSKMGDNASAVQGLEEVIAKFNKFVPPEQNTAIERMPGVSPKLSDLRTALESLRAGKEIDLKLDVEPVVKDYPPIRKCHNAIAAGDQKLAKEYLDDLLRRYDGNVPQPLEAIGELNLYSCILSLAREASDRGWYPLANGTMTQLQKEAYGKDTNEVARIFLQFEIAYNARNAKNGEEQWNKLHELYSDSRFAWSESLRHLAVAFYYANEFKRAEYAIDRAFTACDQEIGHSAKLTRYDSSTGEKIMMQAYAACIAAKQGKFDKADSYWKQVVSQAPLRQDGYRFAAMELSSVYLSNGDKAKAIKVLQEVHSKPTDTAIRVDNGVTALDLQLAKLLLETGQTKEAYQIAKSAQKEKPEYLHWDQILLVAKCAEAGGDFELAAKNYGLARMRAGGSMIFRDGRTGPNYMEKAVTLAEKVPNFDKKKLAEIYKDYAMSVSADSNKAHSALAAYQKAYALLPESDQQKSHLLINIANLKSVIDRSAYKPDTTKNKSGISDDYLKAQEEAARLAEKNGQHDARELWSHVANSKAARGDIDAALVDERHLMQLYSARDVTNHLGVLVHSAVVYWLVRAGRKAEAEKLLLEAVQKTKAVAGEKSINTQAQWVDVFEFYVKQKNYNAALNALSEALKGNLSTGETLTHYMNYSHCGPGWPQSANAVDLLNSIFRILFAKDVDLTFVSTAMQRVLKAHEAAVQPSDERLVPTLAHVGDSLFNLQKYGEAEKYYDRAYAISKRYQKGEFAVRQVGKHFLENLRKLGKTSEADELANLD